MKDNNENKLSEQNVKENHATDQEKRRKAVKNILMAGGSAITAGQLGSEKWIKPVVDSVVLPAHAATSGIGFSLTDPVALTYVCGGTSSYDVIVDIGGFIDAQIAGIAVHLELTWAPVAGQTLTETPPISVDEVTAADGSYSSPDHNIGYRVGSVTVVASLPDYPAAGTDQDTITPNYDNGGYYCLPPSP